eukprot:8285203-Pyramimonas_sp.AAC.1
MHAAATEAWAVLSNAWGHFVDCAEVELHRVLGTEAKDLGERSRTIKASWVSVFYRPKNPDDTLQVIAGWKWVFQTFTEMFNSVAAEDCDLYACQHLQ